MARKYKVGVKFDLGKDQWCLFPFEVLRDVVRVLMLGARKYAPFNWQLVVVKNPDRYFDACMRHLVAIRSGERRDPESGISHYAHAICCLIFLLWNDQNSSKHC